MTAPAAIECRDLVELVTDYLEDALLGPERARLEEHLAGCEGCTRYLEQMRITIRLSGMLTEDAIPLEGRDELLGVFRSWREGSAR
jgi:predicted anti-sigma-YlaC factor YlaD